MVDQRDFGPKPQKTKISKLWIKSLERLFQQVAWCQIWSLVKCQLQLSMEIKTEGPVNTAPEKKIFSGLFTLKANQMFSVHTTPGKIWQSERHRSFWSIVWGIQTQQRGKSRYYRNVIVFKGSVFKGSVFGPHLNAKPAFSNSSGLKSVFEKLRFRDELV